MLLHQRPLHRQLERQPQAAGICEGQRPHCSPRQQQQQQHLNLAVASSSQDRRRVSRHARPLGQLLEEAKQEPTSIDAGEVAEAVSTSVKKTTRHLINSPTTACIALNLGAALFGSNQARCRCCCCLRCSDKRISQLAAVADKYCHRWPSSMQNTASPQGPCLHCVLASRPCALHPTQSAASSTSSFETLPQSWGCTFLVRTSPHSISACPLLAFILFMTLACFNHFAK